MKNLFDYFSAPDDEVALTALETGPETAGLPTVLAKRVDPYLQMGSLESLLTGASYEEVITRERFSEPLGSPEIEGKWLITLTDGLRDALTAATLERLAEITGAWARDEELEGKVDLADLASFLRTFAGAARSAHGQGHHLYCLISRSDSAQWELRPGTV